MDVGEINHHPPSLTFFFIAEGKLGPPQSLLHRNKNGGEMSVCVCVQRYAQEKHCKEGK